MPKHIVKPGECLASIARQYGFVNPLLLYQHADNAALRKLRKNPDILAPGDEVVIPKKQAREIKVKAGGSANLTLDKAVTKVHLKVCDNHGMKCAAERYELAIDGIEEPFKGKLTSKG